MTSTAHTNFLGIPVDGDIRRGDSRTPQRPLSELEPLIRAVLADPTIHSFGWHQYTPYFNDGEPCVFSTGDVWIRTVDDVEKPEPSQEQVDTLEKLRDALHDGLVSTATFDQAYRDVYGHAEGEEPDDEDDETYSMYYSEHPTLGHRPYTYAGSRYEKVYGDYVGPDEARYDRCRALADAIHSDAFDDVLLDAFGDHARITVTAHGITVEEYSHD